MTGWYYSTGPDQKGPLGEEELRALIKNKTIGDKTRLWKKGMDSWSFADEIRELDTIFGRLPPLPIPLQTATVASVVLPEVKSSLSLARPWSRFWARFIDSTILIMPLGFAIGYAKGFWELDFRLGSPEMHPWLMTTLLQPVICLLLALMMTATGTTIGKAIIG